MVKLKEDIIRYSLFLIILIGIMLLGYYLEKNSDQINLVGRAYDYDEFGAVPSDAKERSIPARAAREKRSLGISPEEEFYMNQCLTLGCYDPDGEDANAFGKVYLRKQKAGGKQYCVSTPDSCKDYEGKWYVIEQTCKVQDADKGYFITQQIPKLCEGKCDQGKCMPPTCNDGIKNQDEEQVDCGGPCNKCVSEQCKDPTGVTPLVKDSVLVKDVNGNDLPIYDTCVDNNENTIEESTMLFERICKNNNIDKEKIHCKCKDGACEKAWCIDDDEKNIHNKGIVVGISSGNIYGDPLTLQDTCSYGEGTGESESGSHVIELFCSEEDYLSYGDFIKCPEGEWCFNGVCEKVTCQDTDSGLKYEIAGKTTGLQTDKYGETNYYGESDECIKGIDVIKSIGSDEAAKIGIKAYNWYLNEWFCKNNGVAVEPFHLCPAGCSNGACEEAICIDEDKGKNKYDSGKTVLKSKKTNQEVDWGSDRCFLNMGTKEVTINFLGGQLSESYCESSEVKEQPIVCSNNEICSFGLCVQKEKLFCYQKNNAISPLKGYYLENDKCSYTKKEYKGTTYEIDECGSVNMEFIISDGTFENMYIVKILNWQLTKPPVNNEIKFGFYSNLNQQSLTGDISLNIHDYQEKTFPFNDGKETTFDYKGIKFTLVIDTNKKSIFFKDLGQYPKELQTIQCPIQLVAIPLIDQAGTILQNMQCVDTDGNSSVGKDIYVKGKAGLVIPIQEDSCSLVENGGETIQGPYVIEQTCQDNSVKQLYKKCPNGEYCKEGLCKQIYCVDEDNGLDSHKQAGANWYFIDEQGFQKYYDNCISNNEKGLVTSVFLSNKLSEGYCDKMTSLTKHKELVCLNNEICRLGECTNKQNIFCNKNHEFYIEGQTITDVSNKLQSKSSSYPYIIISGNTYNNLFFAIITNLDYINNKIIIDFTEKNEFSFKNQPKTYKYQEGNDLTITQNNITFTLVINEKQNSIYLKDLGEYPAELKYTCK